MSSEYDCAACGRPGPDHEDMCNRFDALQQQLAAMTNSLDTATGQAQIWCEQVTELQAQLQAREQELKEEQAQHYIWETAWEKQFSELQAREATIAADVKRMEQATILIQSQRHRLAILEARNTELEHALRLHLVVSPNDPLLIEPLEQRVVRLEGELLELKKYDVRTMPISKSFMSGKSLYAEAKLIKGDDDGSSNKQ